LADELEIDSIKAIEITVAIEKKFKISVRDEDVPKITTVKEAVELVTALLSQSNSAHVTE
jgi:acyl carrier protein